MDTVIHYTKRVLLIVFTLTVGWWLITHPEVVVTVFTALVTFGKAVGVGFANAINTVFGGKG